MVGLEPPPSNLTQPARIRSRPWLRTPYHGFQKKIGPPRPVTQRRHRCAAGCVPPAYQPDAELIALCGRHVGLIAAFTPAERLRLAARFGFSRLALGAARALVLASFRLTAPGPRLAPEAAA